MYSVNKNNHLAGIGIVMGRRYSYCQNFILEMIVQRQTNAQILASGNCRFFFFGKGHTSPPVSRDTNNIFPDLLVPTIVSTEETERRRLIVLTSGVALQESFMLLPQT